MFDDPKPDDMMSLANTLHITIEEFNSLRGLARKRYGSDERKDMDTLLSSILREAINGMTQEQAQEYREVAALVCEDVELLVEVVDYDPNMTNESIRQHIKMLKERKDATITDQEARKQRFKSIMMLYTAAANGEIRCDEVNPDGTIKD